MSKLKRSIVCIFTHDLCTLSLSWQYSTQPIISTRVKWIREKTNCFNYILVCSRKKNTSNKKCNNQKKKRCTNTRSLFNWNTKNSVDYLNKLWATKHFETIYYLLLHNSKVVVYLNSCVCLCIKLKILHSDPCTHFILFIHAEHTCVSNEKVSRRIYYFMFIMHSVLCLLHHIPTEHTVCSHRCTQSEREWTSGSKSWSHCIPWKGCMFFFFVLGMIKTRLPDKIGIQKKKYLQLNHLLERYISLYRNEIIIRSWTGWLNYNRTKILTIRRQHEENLKTFVHIKWAFVMMIQTYHTYICLRLNPLKRVMVPS